MTFTPKTWLLLGMGHHDRRRSREVALGVTQTEIQAEQMKICSENPENSTRLEQLES